MRSGLPPDKRNDGRSYRSIHVDAAPGFLRVVHALHGGRCSVDRAKRVQGVWRASRPCTFHDADAAGDGALAIGVLAEFQQLIGIGLRERGGRRCGRTEGMATPIVPLATIDTFAASLPVASALVAVARAGGNGPVASFFSTFDSTSGETASRAASPTAVRQNIVWGGKPWAGYRENVIVLVPGSIDGL